MSQRIPEEREVLALIKDCSNWGRWGADNQLGTVNYITAGKRKQAALLVREGRSVTCGRIIKPELGPDVYSPALRHMIGTGEPYAGGRGEPGQLQSSSEFLGLDYHGLTTTHIDSLAHVFWEGKMYNGYPAELVTSKKGAMKESIDLLRDGVVTRGVLLDVVRTKGVKWLDKGYGVMPEDLEATENSCHVRVESGDAVLLRTGHLRKRNELGPYPMIAEGYAGFQAACIPWLHSRQVAVCGSDVPNDVHPSGYSLLSSPMHQIGIVAMGLWLLDNANLEELAAACEEYQRWEFLFVIAPLRVQGGTGSPVNPIAVF